jgi:thiocyanate hydrolase subunit alpha
MSKVQHDRTHHAKIATGIGDPQCFRDKAAPPKFKEGDQVRVKNLPDIFYSRCQVYTRGAVGTVTRLVYESPAAEDEAWDNTDQPEWFYSVVFRQTDLWPDYHDLYSNDTLETEFSERWLESA